jgi:hypothetical protein
MIGHEIGDVDFEGATVRFFFPVCELQQDKGDFRRVLFDDSVQQIDKGLTGLSVHGAHHPKIYQTNDVVGQDEDIAGVGIGLEETVLKNHAQQNVGPPRSDQLAVESGRHRAARYPKP